MFKLQQQQKQYQKKQKNYRIINNHNNMSSDNIKYTQVQFIETVLDIANNGWANSIIGEDQKNWVCGRIMSRLPDDWVSKKRFKQKRKCVFFRGFFNFILVFVGSSYVSSSR